MTDVRLTATNPEDSSAVPVACNSRGELLITEPVIETIPNDLTIDGVLKVRAPDDIREPGSFYPIDYGEAQYRLGGLFSTGGSAIYLAAGGYRNASDQWVATDPNGGTCASEVVVHSNSAKISFRVDDDKNTGDSWAVTERFQINTSGPTAQTLILRPEGLEKSGGKVIDVSEELQFLRAQVQAIAEKLRMTPEGGWPVWDGSD